MSQRRASQAKVTGLLISGWVSPLLAAPTNGDTTSALQIGPAGDYLLKSMLILVVLLAVMALLLKLLRRYGHLKKVTGNRIRVIEAISLGGQERALLVSVDDRELLLGVSQGRVEPLLTLSEGSTQLQPAADPDTPTGKGPGFADLLASEQH